MKRCKKVIEPIKLADLEKRTKSSKKLGLITAVKNKKRLTFRLTEKDISTLLELQRIINKQTGIRYSQADILSMLLALGERSKIQDMLNAYAETFKIY